MVYGLIALLILLAMAPLWHFMPSRRQRLQAGLREAAALEGLFVEFRDLPLPAARLQRMPASERQVLYYGRRLRRSRGGHRSPAAWWRDKEQWAQRPVARDPTPAVAMDMPSAVLALGLSEDSCGCYWREEGDRDTVQSIARLLHAWAGSLEEGG